MTPDNVHFTFSDFARQILGAYPIHSNGNYTAEADATTSDGAKQDVNKSKLSSPSGCKEYRGESPGRKSRQKEEGLTPERDVLD